ncbi:MAG TPA: zeta toxin family protein [Gammaproteobacteria bacterium]|nr:zeta toxin family protein [Gammaproteobacteria bacterium]
MSDKNLFLIAGPNGAGKTTSSFPMLKKFSIDEYVNADAIAYGLSPLQYDTVAIKSGRLMLERIHYLLEQNKSFAFETTLASRSFVNLIQQAKKQNYNVSLIFLWLDNVELALERVEHRVEAGGHDIPRKTVIRRYEKGLKNFFDLYAPIVDRWSFYDNSRSSPNLIAEKLHGALLDVHNTKLWEFLSKHGDKK